MKSLAEIRKDEVIAKFLKKVGKIPRPPCFKCRHKVPKIQINYDSKRDEILVELHCHKDKEVIRIPANKISEIASIEIGWAFHRSSYREGGEIVRSLH